MNIEQIAQEITTELGYTGGQDEVRSVLKLGLSKMAAQEGERELALLAQLAEKDAELNSMWVQLCEANGAAAASQAREQLWIKRVASTNILLEAVCAIHPDSAVAKYELDENRQTLALPQDTAALEALLAKAVEMMRDRCLDKACGWIGIDEAIRALPGVTLEDLK